MCECYSQTRFVHAMIQHYFLFKYSYIQIWNKYFDVQITMRDLSFCYLQKIFLCKCTVYGVYVYWCVYLCVHVYVCDCRYAQTMMYVWRSEDNSVLVLAFYIFWDRVSLLFELCMLGSYPWDTRAWPISACHLTIGCWGYRCPLPRLASHGTQTHLVTLMR